MMVTRRSVLPAVILFLVLLLIGIFYPRPVVSALQSDTATPTGTPTATRTPGPTPTPRTQALRRSVLSNSVRGLGLNAPNDANLPPCQNADFGLSLWQDLQPTGTAVQVGSLRRQDGVMLRITDSFFPAICASDPIGSASATNLSTGETFPAAVWDYDPSEVQSNEFFYEGFVSRYYVAQLPIEAYARPGNWRLHIDSPQPVDLDISITAAQGPSGLLNANGTYLVTGFQPGERVVGLIFNDTFTDDGGSVAEVTDDFEFIVNSAGTGQHTSTPYWNVTSSEITVGLMLLVGDQGSGLFYPLGEFGTFIFSSDGSATPADLDNDGQITDQELIEYVRRGYWGAQTASVSCDSLLPPRLTIGGRARVLPGLANNLRASASRDSERIGSVSGGIEFEVLAGPVCSGGYFWWQIRFDGLTGWTAESGDGNYWLEPLSGASVTEPAPGVIFSRNLFVTSPFITGEDVSAVQSRLIDLGYDPGPVDGVFGPRTEAAVRQYQQNSGLAVDGIVGPITWGSLFP
jgi:hypothetical protein